MATAATTTANKESWWPLIWGLAALLLLPFLPPFDTIVPIQQTLLLLILSVAVCAVVGWRLGARLAIAVIWIALSGWMLVQPIGAGGGQYDVMVRGWALLLAASFGLVSLWSDVMPFFTRALCSVALALAVGFGIALSSPSGIARFDHTAGEEFARRVATDVQLIEERRSTPEWQQMAERLPAFDAVYDDTEDILREIPARSSALLPALLALESLAALGVGWALYRRISSVKIGPPLGRLADFRFNDQLIWGLAVGATLCLLPQFEEGKTAGYNLLTFFGFLYLIRGTGVLGWIAKGRYVVIFLLTLIPQVFLLFVVITLALGLGDTWFDLRRRVNTTSP